MYFRRCQKDDFVFIGGFNFANVSCQVVELILRKRVMASNPKMEYQVFLCILPKNSPMATIGLKGMGKFLWEVREKGLSCWLSQFSKTKRDSQLGKLFSLSSQENFPISFKPNVATAKFNGKMQKKSLVL